jgi:DNA primase
MHQVALRYHRRLPERIRRYLRERGIVDSVIHKYLIGWNGTRITIPVRDKNAQIASFRLARDPQDTEGPKMLSTSGTHAELYGWEVLLAKPKWVIICEGEFDRLVLASYGFSAVTSTGGAATFRDEWACRLSSVPQVYICFDRDDAGRHGAAMIASRIRHAKIVALPPEVADGGDVSDYFVRCGHTSADFELLLKTGESITDSLAPKKTVRSRRTYPHISRAMPIEEVIRQVLPLRGIGAAYVANCPFHDDRRPSFVVFPDSYTFHCFGCGKHGDVIDFLRLRFGLSFVAAVALLREYKRNGEES